MLANYHLSYDEAHHHTLSICSNKAFTPSSVNIHSQKNNSTIGIYIIHLYRSWQFTDRCILKPKVVYEVVKIIAHRHLKHKIRNIFKFSDNVSFFSPYMELDSMCAYDQCVKSSTTSELDHESVPSWEGVGLFSHSSSKLCKVAQLLMG